ncbi:MAG: glycosyltransferase, partial [Muribaculaceae bacterium]|nr:glycosyltransferase [Muribaculaceae bacterium]
MLSIVIPAYNAETYLEECLESVMACVGHCRTRCEVIVVDDGSTDSTPEIVSRFDSIRLIRQPNRGLSAARNKGIDMAVGEWLMFVDADDCLLSGAPDALVEAAEATKCRIAAGRCLSGQTHVGTKIEILHDVSVLSAPSAIEQTLYQQTPLLGSAWGKIWHKSIFGNLRFSEGLYYEDLDFFYKAFLKSGAVALIETPVYFYRIHGSSFLRTFSPKLLDVLKVTAAMESYMRMHYPSLLKAARDRRLSANFN